VLPGPVAAVVGSPVEEFGRLYMAFNNAGIMISLSNAADEPAEAFAESLPSICAGSGPRYRYAQKPDRKQCRSAIRAQRPRIDDL
jgi:hypothetical protein